MASFKFPSLGRGDNQKGFSPPPLSSPLKGEEIVFDESQKPRLLRRGASLLLLLVFYYIDWKDYTSKFKG